MGWSLVKYLLWALLLIVQIHEHGACLEEERMCLLELKAFLKSNVNHTNHLFPSWVNDPFKELKNLDLSANGILEWLKNEDEDLACGP
nr:hypothetical protein CFP56_42876 [Quercus suber]